MRVRRATPVDAEELARLRYAFRAEEAPTVEELPAFVVRATGWLRSALASDRWVAWVAETDGHPVGHVFLQLVDKVPNPAEESERLGYLTNAYVDPEHRGAGVGTRLIDAVTSYAQDERLDCVIVWPSERSEPLYRRAGFRPPPDMLVLSPPDD
ncbi:MAG: GNAT family N-acetyltransferase [Streptosporangiales bacterium]|nr:GNAT family N-acetyltransferase [Streptosporangiales bacterium]